MKHLKLKSVALAAVVTSFCFGSLFAATNEFTGPSGGSWDEDANWSLERPPTAEDDVIISGKTVNITNGVTMASLTLASKAKLKVMARPLADLSPFGVSKEAATAALWANRLVVKVTGAFTVPSGCTVYPYNDGLTGTPVVFEVGSADIAGSVDASGTGWMWKLLGDKELPAGAFKQHTNSGTTWYYSFAFGAYTGEKGAYGRGGNYGASYGSATAPFLPGSQSSIYSENFNTRGGGSIVIHATGAINLSGSLVTGGNRNGQNGGCAGGSVWLAGKTVTRTAGSSITANGDAGLNGNQGQGQGGRICLTVDATADELATLISGAVPPSFIVTDLSVDNVKATGAQAGSNKASDGTVKLATSDRVRTRFVVRTDAGADLTATGITWGESVLDVGAAYEFAAPEHGFLSTDASNVRWPFTGYVLSNATVEVAREDTRTVGFTPVEGEGPYSLTWLTGTRETRTAVSFVGNGAGAVTEGGVAHDADFEVWKNEASSVTLTAAAATGSTFVEYMCSDLTGGFTTEMELTLSAAKPHAVSAYFVVGNIKRVWIGAANASWDVTTNWSPVGVPAASDEVFLTNATLTVGHALTVKALTIAGSSKVTFQATEMAGESTAANLYANAMVIDVEGRFEVSGTAVVTAANDAKSGKAVKFTCGSFLLGENATVTASEKGWAWFAGTDPYQTFAQGDEKSGYYWTRAMGPGGRTTSGEAYNTGAGYGANGGNQWGNFGKAYGYKYAPFLPGSPNGMYGWTYSYTGPGGGTVWIVSKGLCELNGKVTSKGKNKTYGTPSGGGIWIAAAGFKVGANATLAAEGGDIDTWYGSRGAGGRVSLAVGLSQDQLDWLAAGNAPADYKDHDLTAVDSIELVPVSVKGGYYAKDKVYGNSGTATTVTGPYGLKTVYVQSTGVLAQGVSPDYGANAYADGSVQRFTAPEHGADPANDLIRYRCLGYVVSNVTEQVAEGAGLSVDVTVADAPMTVTWKWGAAERAVAIRKPEHATLTLGGEAQTGDAVQWTTGTMAEVGVVPDDGYEFVCWRGNVPFGLATANPLVFAANEPVDATPVVRAVAEAMTRVWTGVTGDWYESANWDPAGVPGAADTVEINAGTCKVGNYFGVAGLTISGGKLSVAAADNVCGQVVVSGDMVLTGGSAVLGREKTQTKRASLSVGGDLTLANAAKLHVFGAPITATDSFATGTSDISVGGAFTLGDTATLCLYSDWLTGGSVKVTVGTFELAEGAKVDADEKGFMWLDNSTAPNSIGTGWDYDTGAGHGVSSWSATAKNGHFYGFVNAPVMPGSPSGIWSGSASRGGGLVRIHAKSMSILGTITANANVKSEYGGASGGGIWLTADAYAFGTNAVLTARGGSAGNNEHHYGSVGAGGRIAVGYQLKSEQIDALAESGTWTGLRSTSRRLKSLEQFRETLGNTNMTVDVTSVLRYQDQSSCTGTFRFVDGKQPGLTVLVR